MDLQAQTLLDKLLEQLKRMPEWVFILLYLSVIGIYSFVIGVQGFDMCDEGFCLTAYQQLFEHPISAEYQFLYYNSILIGAIWNNFFGYLGIFGFRVFNIIIRLLSAYVVYKVLRKYINRWCIFFGVVLVVFNLRYLLVFHWNDFTGLVVLLTAWVLHSALTQRRGGLFSIAGGLIAVNIFSRIPNVSMLSLSLTLLPFYCYTKDAKLAIRMFGYAIFGFIIGVLMQIGIMMLLGHWNIFVDSIFSSGVGQIAERDSEHNMMLLLNVYLSNYQLVIKCVASIIFFPMILWNIPNLNANKILHRILCIIMAIIYIWMMWEMSKTYTFMLYAVLYLILILYLLKNYQNGERMYLVVIALIIMFFLPFGSNYGIENMGPHCVWLAAPLAFGLLCEEIIDSTSIYTGYIYSFRRLLIICSVFICVSTLSIACIKHTYKNANYFDSARRSEMTYKINNPLATTYTTKSKCDIMNELLYHLNDYVKEGDYLLAYYSIPMINYLTHTYPYLNCSWVSSYDPAQIRAHFATAEQQVDVLPVILRHKSGLGNWTKYNEDWDSTSSTDQFLFNANTIGEIQKFIYRHSYRIVWENELWQILTAEKQSEKENT